MTAAPAPAPALTACLQPWIERGALAGAVVLACSAERVLGLEAAGWADIAARRPMRADSVFWVASMTKPVTGALLMTFVDEGLVSLDDPVAKHLPDFAQAWLAAERADDRVVLRRPARPITVRDVMAHTSGLPFMTGPEGGKIDRLTLRECAVAYALTPLEAEPGSRYAYSNAGINLAGRIIEVVAGAPFERVLDKRLLQPLGMTETTFWPNAALLGRLATAYRPDASRERLVPIPVEQCTYPLDDRRRTPCPAGGLFSTAADMGRFCRMVLGDGVFEGRRVLSPAAVRTMTSRQTDAALPTSYGVGWSCDPERAWYGHGGAYRTDLWIDARRRFGVIYLPHHDGYAAADGDAILPAVRAAAATLA